MATTIDLNFHYKWEYRLQAGFFNKVHTREGTILKSKKGTILKPSKIRFHIKTLEKNEHLICLCYFTKKLIWS